MHIVQPGLVSDASLSSLAQAFPPTVAWQMLSKLSRPYNADELPQAKRLRANLVDLFASNVVLGIEPRSCLQMRMLQGLPTLVL